MDAMNLLVEIAGGAVASAVGYTAGIVHERRKKPSETCLCGHTSNLHSGVQCHGQGAERVTRYSYSRYGERVTHFVIDPCPCRRYVGPISTYIPELEN